MTGVLPSVPRKPLVFLDWPLEVLCLNLYFSNGRQNDLSKTFIIFIIIITVFVISLGGQYGCQGACVEVRRKLCGVISLHLFMVPGINLRLSAQLTDDLGHSSLMGRYK